MKRVDAGFSYKLALPLTLAVLSVHLAFLQGASLTAPSSPIQAVRSFNTRMIEALPLRPPVTRSTPLPKPRTLPPKPLPVPSEAPAETPITSVSPSQAHEPVTASTADAVAVTPTEAAPVRDQAQDSSEEIRPAPRQLREQVASAGSYTIPGSLTLQYRVQSNKFPYSLNAEFGWQHNGEIYEARLAFGAFGFTRVQTSRGQITPEGLAPMRFSDKYRSEVAAHFVRDKGKITFSANTPDVALLAGAQDRLSIVVQLAAMLAGDAQRFPLATTIALQTVGARDADTWLFTVENDEVLELPGGAQPTRRLVRNARREFDQKVELWLAPTLGYLPARIRITESNGDYIDQKWFTSEPQL
jgi:hypothetical protein